ncbi:DUF551 domain-containing protein [Serratia marcescens]|uniref:DUF551 domain-containing protein n=1 Tax=Serratia marcescens TaxID=615 RepID=UPI002742D7D3|nr:DUF551 domain-containing protein [Serratia marcescens]MDP8704262.1 DUF551 domain-containing protein [Serratia marcescens]
MTLTTERLKELLEELKSWQYGYDPVDDKEQFDMLATAEWAVIELLANREAQPVAYLNKFSGVCMTLEQQPNADDDVAVYSPLYTAPPAPAVPGEISTRQAIVKMDSHEPCDSINVAYKLGWNACRAAMLAQPVSSSYKLPEGWIVCSEQTPVADGAYWCWFGKEKPSVIQQRVCIWNDRNHEWCDSAVTHWMPLPTAPEGGNDHDTRR